MKPTSVTSFQSAFGTYTRESAPFLIRVVHFLFGGRVGRWRGPVLKRPSPMTKSRKKRKAPKPVLALPDLEQAKSAVLNTLTSKSGQRTYDHAITEFVEWYCSEPRLAFNRTVVLRYRISLEQRQYAPSTINLRLAAGIRRVKGVRRLGVSVGNWLTAEQGNQLLAATSPDTPRIRTRAVSAIAPATAKSWEPASLCDHG